MVRAMRGTFMRAAFAKEWGLALAVLLRKVPVLLSQVLCVMAAPAGLADLPFNRVPYVTATLREHALQVIIIRRLFSNPVLLV